MGNGEPASWTCAEVFARRWLDDDTAGATGQYVIRFDDGSTAMGNFAATRCKSGPPICG
jgi:hypothetical protein